MWNVRGVANIDLYGNVKQFVDMQNPDILLRRTIRLLGYGGYCYSDVRRYAGVFCWSGKRTMLT